jgi:pilus assembly protein Flp/PilA
MLNKLKEALRRQSDSEGATAVEYGIMVALIAIVIIAAVAFLGGELESDFECVGSSISGNSNVCPQ